MRFGNLSELYIVIKVINFNFYMSKNLCKFLVLLLLKNTSKIEIVKCKLQE